MAFSFDHAFVIKAPADKVYAYLIDPYRVAPALPGASIGEKTEDGGYTGAITVKAGPVSAKYRGKMRFDVLDPATRTVCIVASGQDTSGRGGADMRMQSHLVESTPGETEVSISSEVNVTGILAQFGRGMIQDVSNQIFQRFVQAVRAELEKQDAAPVAPSVAVAPVAVASAAGSGATAPPAAVASAPVLAADVPGAVVSQTADAPSGAAHATISQTADTPSAPPPAMAHDAALGRATSRASVAEAPPIDIVSVGGKALGRAAIRSLGRPGLWVAAILVILALYWFMQR